MATTTAKKTDTLAAAFLKAQSEFPEIGKDSEANAGSYSYRYASLPAILGAILPVLHANGFSLMQDFNSDGQMVTRIRHNCGEQYYSVFSMPSPAGMKPQEFGALLSYMRRYSLTAMLGIAPDDDVDAQGVEAPTPIQPPLAAPQPADTPASKHSGIATRIIDEEHDLVEAWSVAPLATRGAALRTVGDLLDSIELDNGDDLYTAAVRSMKNTVDRRNA